MLRDADPDAVKSTDESEVGVTNESEAVLKPHQTCIAN